MHTHTHTHACTKVYMHTDIISVTTLATVFAAINLQNKYTKTTKNTQEHSGPAGQHVNHNDRVPDTEARRRKHTYTHL